MKSEIPKANLHVQLSLDHLSKTTMNSVSISIKAP